MAGNLMRIATDETRWTQIIQFNRSKNVVQMHNGFIFAFFPSGSVGLHLWRLTFLLFLSNTSQYCGPPGLMSLFHSDIPPAMLFTSLKPAFRNAWVNVIERPPDLQWTTTFSSLCGV